LKGVQWRWSYVWIMLNGIWMGLHHLVSRCSVYTKQNPQTQAIEAEPSSIFLHQWHCSEVDSDACVVCSLDVFSPWHMTDPMATFSWLELLPIWQGSSRREELVAWQPYALAGQAAEEELNQLRACMKFMQISLP
jgi:hypothetical protein